MTITPIRPKRRGTMTDHERFNRQMHYLPVDHCFNMEFGYWDENYKLWPMFVENGITNETQANQFFNFDPIPVISGNVRDAGRITTKPPQDSYAKSQAAFYSADS